MGFAGYDAWKLATPPEYELGPEPDEDDLRDEAPCERCLVLTLRVFLRPASLVCAPDARVCPGCVEAAKHRVEDVSW